MPVTINLEGDHTIHRPGQLAISYSVISVEQRKKCKRMHLIGVFSLMHMPQTVPFTNFFPFMLTLTFLTPWLYMQRWGFLFREVINHLKDTELISGRTRNWTSMLMSPSALYHADSDQVSEWLELVVRELQAYKLWTYKCITVCIIKNWDRLPDTLEIIPLYSSP